MKPLFRRKQAKKFKKLGRFGNNVYLCIDKSRPLPIRTAYPAGHFLYIDMRYTKQAMTLAQQIQTLQSRGLIIADTNKAEQALDAISYFRLADYWYHLEADHHTHQFLPNSHFEEVLACYYFDKDLNFSRLFRLSRWLSDRKSSNTLLPHVAHSGLWIQRKP